MVNLPKHRRNLHESTFIVENEIELEKVSLSYM